MGFLVRLNGPLSTSRVGVAELWMGVPAPADPSDPGPVQGAGAGI